MNNGFSLPSVSVECQKNDCPLPPPLGGRLKFSILSSGSGGNSVYIEADGKRILIDAGLSEKKLSQRMAHIDWMRYLPLTSTPTTSAVWARF